MMALLAPLVALLAVVIVAEPSHSPQRVPNLLGRWVGESECVGDHPGCHPEHVLYQVDSTGVGAVRLQGARFAGSDTVDMGPLACRIDGRWTAATCRIAIGVWRFWITQDHLEGSLVLADSSVARHVVARRLPTR